MNSNMDSPAPTVKRKGDAGGDREPVEVGQILNKAQVIHRLKIGPNTLGQWTELGLKTYEPPGMASSVTTGDDLLEFIKRFPAGVPEKKPVPKKRKRKES